MWEPAIDSGDGGDKIRDGAWVVELTGLLDLSTWPAGIRVIARKERPHPGTQLRITDIDGLRLTAFATNTPPGAGHGQLADLELRRRRRARCEDRIRIAKDTGLRALPLHDFAQNQIWVAVVALAADLLAWMAMLALTGTQARRWEPKRLRLRLFTVPATLARHSRRDLIHYAEKHPGPHWFVTPSTDSDSTNSQSPAETDTDHPDQPSTTPDPWNPAPARATSAPAVTPHSEDQPTSNHRPQSEPNPSTPRKIEVR